jgi:muramoyltetrapeptide carboxypeptidase
VAVGAFTDCAPGQHGVTVEQVLASELSRLGVPVVTGLPFGHEPPNHPLLLGVEAELDADAACLSLGRLS